MMNDGGELLAQIRALPDGCVLFLGGRGIVPETKSRNPKMPGIVRAELDRFIDRAYRRGRRRFLSSSRTVFERYAAEQVLRYREKHMEISLFMLRSVKSEGFRLELYEETGLTGYLSSERDTVDDHSFREYLNVMLPNCAEIAFNSWEHGRIEPLLQTAMGAAEELAVRRINLNTAIRNRLFQRKEKYLLKEWIDYGDDNPLTPFYLNKIVPIPHNPNPASFLTDRSKTVAFHGMNLRGSSDLVPPPYLANAFLTVLREAVDRALERGRHIFIVNSASEFTKIAVYVLTEKRRLVPEIQILNIEGSSRSNEAVVKCADYSCGLSAHRDRESAHRLSEFQLAHSAEILGCLPEKVYSQAWIVRYKDAFGCPFLNLRSEYEKYIQIENWMVPCFDQSET